MHGIIFVMGGMTGSVGEAISFQAAYDFQPKLLHPIPLRGLLRTRCMSIESSDRRRRIRLEVPYFPNIRFLENQERFSFKSVTLTYLGIGQESQGCPGHTSRKISRMSNCSFETQNNDDA